MAELSAQRWLPHSLGFLSLSIANSHLFYPTFCLFCLEHILQVINLVIIYIYHIWILLVSLKLLPYLLSVVNRACEFCPYFRSLLSVLILIRSLPYPACIYVFCSKTGYIPTTANACYLNTSVLIACVSMKLILLSFPVILLTTIPLINITYQLENSYLPVGLVQDPALLEPLYLCTQFNWERTKEKSQGFPGKEFINCVDNLLLAKDYSQLFTKRNKIQK